MLFILVFFLLHFAHIFFLPKEGKWLCVMVYPLIWKKMLTHIHNYLFIGHRIQSELRAIDNRRIIWGAFIFLFDFFVEPVCVYVCFFIHSAKLGTTFRITPTQFRGG